MKTCKVRPSASECRMCADINDELPKCSQCGYNTARYELLEIVSGIFNDYAFVQNNGRITKVPLENLYDIKEETENV